VQRRHEYGKTSFEFAADIFTPTRSLIEEDLRTERILSIDGENNIYAVREEDNGIMKIINLQLKN